MTTKYSKMFYGTVKLTNQDAEEIPVCHPIALEYYRTTSPSKNLLEAENFGVEIVKKEYRNNRIELERKRVENITRDARTADSFIALLKRNQVTPISLEEVVWDLFHVSTHK